MLCPATLLPIRDNSVAHLSLLVDGTERVVVCRTCLRGGSTWQSRGGRAMRSPCSTVPAGPASQPSPTPCAAPGTTCWPGMSSCPLYRPSTWPLLRAHYTYTLARSCLDCRLGAYVFAVILLLTVCTVRSPAGGLSPCLLCTSYTQSATAT